MTAREIVAALGGRWLGSYGMAQCPVHDDGRTPALKISDSHHSDGIDVCCFAGCAWRAVKAELKRRGLLTDEKLLQAETVSAPRFDAEQRIREDEKTRALVQAVWHHGRLAAGTLVEQYLTQARRITLPQIGGVPPSLRFSPSLKHGPTRAELPAMVAAVQGPDRRIVGLHRTYLTLKATMTPLSQPRLMLGHCSGGAVRLARADTMVAICEGLETGLAGMQVTGLPVWAALSTSGLRSIILPPGIREVVILADNDGPGLAAAEAAAERLEQEGRFVRIQVPPEGRKDFNDVLLAMRGAA